MVKGERIAFSILDNALDYLRSAADFVGHDTPQGWKYALLHLVAGIELLIKTRLYLEHWSLLFADVDSASREALEKGDFVSVDFRRAVERLSNIAGVELREDDRRRLIDLRRYRNQVQHFAINVSRNSVVSLLAFACHFCLDFTKENLEADLTDEQRTSLEEIARNLVEFDEFVKVRLEEIKPRLAQAYTLLDCPRCWQRALELGDGDPKCHFCYFRAPADQVVHEFDAVGETEQCPECGGPCVSLYDERAEFPAWVCFQCGEGGDYKTCNICGALFSGEPMPGGRCESCWGALMEKD